MKTIGNMKLFVTLIFIFTSCEILSAQSKYNSDSINVRHIFQVLSNQQKAWNDGNIAGYMDGYWKSDSLLFTSGGNIQRGWNATYEKYKKSYDSKKKMGELIFSELEIKLLSEKSAWIFGFWELKRENDNPKGVFTLILRKFKEGWKIIHDHTSSEK
jgi:ketosteroid isomerase-like protein